MHKKACCVPLQVGGVPAVMKHMLAEGLINGSCLTVTGKTVAENLCSVPDLDQSQRVIMPVNSPIKSTGLIQILYGNVAPQGCVAKITGSCELGVRVRVTRLECLSYTCTLLI